MVTMGAASTSGQQVAGRWWSPPPRPVWWQWEALTTAFYTGRTTTLPPPPTASTNSTQTGALSLHGLWAPPTPYLSTSCPAPIQLLVKCQIGWCVLACFDVCYDIFHNNDVSALGLKQDASHISDTISVLNFHLIFFLIIIASVLMAYILFPPLQFRITP